jgi:hypothetical protein
MCREYLHSVTATAAPRRKRRRKPSGVAPVFHAFALIAAGLVVLAWIAQ